MKRIVLVRPLGPRNVGSVLRAIANFGPAELVIAGPVRPSLLVHPDFEQMSHGVEDTAAKVRVVDTVEEAIADCTQTFGFTARGRDHRRLIDWRKARGAIRTAVDAEDARVALVFGSEENGLTGEETRPLQTLVRMPTSNEHGSINLATTVAITLSTLFFDEAPDAGEQGGTPISNGERQFLIEALKAALGERTTSEPAQRDLCASIERVFLRAPLESRDARAWHLLVRALGTRKRPQDFGLPGQETTHRRFKKTQAPS